MWFFCASYTLDLVTDPNLSTVPNLQLARGLVDAATEHSKVRAVVDIQVRKAAEERIELLGRSADSVRSQIDVHPATKKVRDQFPMLTKLAERAGPLTPVVGVFAYAAGMLAAMRPGGDYLDSLDQYEAATKGQHQQLVRIEDEIYQYEKQRDHGLDVVSRRALHAYVGADELDAFATATVRLDAYVAEYRDRFPSAQGDVSQVVRHATRFAQEVGAIMSRDANPAATPATRSGGAHLLS